MPLIYHVYKLLLMAAYGFLIYTCNHDGSLGSYYGSLVLYLLLVPTAILWVASFMWVQRVRLLVHAGHGLVIIAAVLLMLITMLATGEEINMLTLGAIGPAVPVMIEAVISIDHLKHTAFHESRRL